MATRLSVEVTCRFNVDHSACSLSLVVGELPESSPLCSAQALCYFTPDSPGIFPLLVFIYKGILP